MSKVHQQIAVAASHHGRWIQALPIHIVCCKAARTRPHSEVARLLVESGLSGHPLMHSFRATPDAFVYRLVSQLQQSGIIIYVPILQILSRACSKLLSSLSVRICCGTHDGVYSISLSLFEQILHIPQEQ